MSGVVCPACGVAVVPGYVRCPKCRKPLPRRPAAIEGGTAVDSESRSPALLALLALLLVGGAVVAYVVMSGDDKAAVQPVAQETTETAPEPTAVTAPDQPTAAPVAPTGPNAGEVAAELERELKKLRLWATVSVSEGRVDVRSGSCSDPAITPLLDGAAPSFKAAGLTKLRCVEQSGRVVTDRDL